MFDYAFHMNWDLPEHTPLMTSVFEDMVRMRSSHNSGTVG